MYVCIYICPDGYTSCLSTSVLHSFLTLEFISVHVKLCIHVHAGSWHISMRTKIDKSVSSICICYLNIRKSSVNHKL